MFVFLQSGALHQVGVDFAIQVDNSTESADAEELAATIVYVFCKVDLGVTLSC